MTSGRKRLCHFDGIGSQSVPCNKCGRAWGGGCEPCIVFGVVGAPDAVADPLHVAWYESYLQSRAAYLKELP